MLIPMQHIYIFISHHLGTQISSISHTKSSPNKNFIHCSQIQYWAQVSNEALSLWG